MLYYLDEMKVKDIAKKLGIGETTVKQRLFFARNTVRKEVEIMNERNLSLKPVSLAFIGTGNPSGNDPRTKAERILSQNLVYACKDKAKSAKELSDELCVPMPYIEDRGGHSAERRKRQLRTFAQNGRQIYIQCDYCRKQRV